MCTACCWCRCFRCCLMNIWAPYYFGALFALLILNCWKRFIFGWKYLFKLQISLFTHTRYYMQCIGCTRSQTSVRDSNMSNYLYWPHSVLHRVFWLCVFFSLSRFQWMKPSSGDMLIFCGYLIDQKIRFGLRAHFPSFMFVSVDFFFHPETLE